MVRRGESALRVVDALDLEAPAPVAWQFLTPQKPERLLGGARLGPVDLTWEGDLACAIAPTGQAFTSGDPAGAPLWRVTLAARQPVGRGFFAFTFAPAQ